MPRNIAYVTLLGTAGVEDGVSAGPWGGVIQLLLTIFTPSQWESAPGRAVRVFQADDDGLLALLAVFHSSMSFEQVCPAQPHAHPGA